MISRINSFVNSLKKLNKFSSRTYNDLNQYPIMPWTFMADKRLRNFDLPMSLQNEESKERFLELSYVMKKNKIDIIIIIIHCLNIFIII